MSAQTYCIDICASIVVSVLALLAFTVVNIVIGYRATEILCDSSGVVIESRKLQFDVSFFCVKGYWVLFMRKTMSQFY